MADALPPCNGLQYMDPNSEEFRVAWANRGKDGARLDAIWREFEDRMNPVRDAAGAAVPEAAIPARKSTETT